MSETGATAEQIEAAIQSKIASTEGKAPEYADQLLRDVYTDTAAHLVPPGYQIVPAGAVTLSADEVEDVREALSYATSYQEPPLTERQEQRVRRYRALAAKLSGGAS